MIIYAVHFYGTSRKNYTLLGQLIVKYINLKLQDIQKNFGLHSNLIASEGTLKEHSEFQTFQRLTCLSQGDIARLYNLWQMLPQKADLMHA